MAQEPTARLDRLPIRRIEQVPILERWLTRQEVDEISTCACAHRAGLSQCDAEDAAQSALTQIFARVSSPPPSNCGEQLDFFFAAANDGIRVEDWSAWVTDRVQEQVRALLRPRRRERSLTPPDDDGGAGVLEPPDSTPSPERTLAFRKLLPILEDCINNESRDPKLRLTPQERNRFKLRFLDDLSYQEIASQEKCAEENVRRDVGNARQKVLACLERRHAITPAVLEQVFNHDRGKR